MTLNAMKRCSPGTLRQTIDAALSSDTDDCILWPHGTSKGKYGSFMGGRAHPVVCEEAHGPRPDGMEASHTCGVSLCINPRHLRWDSPKGNQSDRRNHGTHLRGETVPTAKLTWPKVRTIRQRHTQGETATGLAREFGVSPATIDCVVHHHTWKEETL